MLPERASRESGFLHARIFFVLCLILSGLGVQDLPGADDGRVRLKYWDKWTGFEADAMRAVVDDFNASQDRISVEFNSVSQIDRRLMLATAGGVPPDVAGIWAINLPAYAENNALTPLDSFAGKAGIRADDYIPAFWKMCRYRDHLWALPSTPGCNALIYNKKMFREAGLDPDRPPRSIAELEAFNEKLTRRSASGRLEAIGHVPEEPGWWSGLWGYWFGGSMVKGGSEITVTSPENLAAYRWVQSYPERFGTDRLLALRDGFGNFASPQNPFFTGRVAMILQGSWIYNFIANYAPADFEWGVAPFPSSDPDHLRDVTIVECDLLVVPAGAKHPEEAFEFIRYVNSRGPMEKLCLGQRKFSPLHECSPSFFEAHPNPFIRTFLELAKSPNARPAPAVTTWGEFNADMKNAVTRIWAGEATAEEALADVQKRQQKNLDRRHERWLRSEPVLTKSWSEQ
jgi:ABC-type glycerol-3-phosphate transport system substrate-binding protein